jgi:hypothetical protein
MFENAMKHAYKFSYKLERLKQSRMVRDKPFEAVNLT